VARHFPIPSRGTLEVSFFINSLSFAVMLTAVGLVSGWLVRRMQFVNLGFATVLGLSAFAYARISMIGPEYFWAGILVAVLFGVFGLFLLLIPRLRLSELDWAMFTFAVQLTWAGFVYLATPYTGGPFGISGIPRLTFGLPSSFGTLAFSLVLVLISIITYVHFEKSRISTQVEVIAASGELARTLGVSPLKVLLFVSVPMGIIIGLSAVAMASYLSFLGPEVFNIDLSVTILAIGFFASRSIVAGVIGAFVIILLPDMFRLIDGITSVQSGYFRMILSGMTIGIGALAIFGTKGARNAAANS